MFRNNGRLKLRKAIVDDFVLVYVHDLSEMQHLIIRREKFLARILLVESRVVET